MDLRVCHEPMHGHEQPARQFGAAPEVQDAQNRTVRDVQSHLSGGSGRLDRARDHFRRILTQVHALNGDSGACQGIPALPSAVALLEPQSERIMMGDNGRQRGVQRAHVEVPWDLHENRVIPMVRVRNRSIRRTTD